MIVLMLKSTLVIAVAACAAGLLKRQSAAVRHVVWSAGLIGALAVPLSSLLLPPWHLGLPETAAPLLPAALEPPFAWTTEAPQVSGSAAAEEAGREEWIPAGAAVTVWIGGAAIGILVLLGGAAKLAWVAVSAEPLTDSRWRAISGEVAAALKLHRPARLLQTRAAPLLGTWGIISPSVLVPSEAEGWSDRRIRMVLAHELAHVRRRDWPVQVLAEASRAIYWFNPLFWLACSRLRRESEHACDDTVLALGVSGDDYAAELLGVTRSLRDPNGARFPILAMAQPSHLERRLVALLNPSLKRLAATPWAVVVVALIAVGLTLPLAAVRSGSTSPIELQVSDPPLEALPPPLAAAAAAEPTGTPAKDSFRGGESVPASESGPLLSDPPAALGAGADCPVSLSVRDTPPHDEKTASFGTGPWFVNEERSIWVWDQPYVAGRGINTVWIRPPGADLHVTGHRLDAEAPPLDARVFYSSAAPPLTFKSSGLRFPTPGCWQVTASAGASELTFVTIVRPSGTMVE